jgi:histidinol-phosphate aminotransferase
MMKNIARQISRRRFGKLLGAGAALVAARPAVSLAEPLRLIGGNQAARLAAGAAHSRMTAAAIVRLSANENPYGPSPMAAKAMADAFSLSCRYPDEHADALIDTLAKINGVARNHILLGDGSGEVLQLCGQAFTGPTLNRTANAVTLAAPSRGGGFAPFTPGRGKLVVADPTFEAILNHARVSGAEVVKVPLAPDFSHDLGKMLAAASEGLIYICNPNNPTASITPKNAMREFLSKAPRESMILVDEAYYHYADSSDYESVIPLVKDHSNLIVARTFSKIYGMAGLRCGYCVAQPETIQRMRPYQSWDSVNIMAIVAAIASLNDADQVANGRRWNGETKRFVTDELNALGYQCIPSQANFMMVDLRQPVRPSIEGLRQRGVQVGRAFPTMPNYMRVTIGTKPEMAAFLAAFRQVAVA